MNQSNSTNSKKNSDNQTEILEKNISTMSRVKKITKLLSNSIISEEQKLFNDTKKYT